jgi:hypothetical protein
MPLTPQMGFPLARGDQKRTFWSLGAVGTRHVLLRLQVRHGPEHSWMETDCQRRGTRLAIEKVITNAPQSCFARQQGRC